MASFTNTQCVRMMDWSNLDNVTKHILRFSKERRKVRLFLTGGTGFFGKWLLESILWMNRELDHPIEVLMLSRNPNSFLKKFPQFTNPEIKFLQGDVRSFQFVDDKFDLVIHAATDASVQLNKENPLLMFDTIVEGTRRTLEFSRISGVKKFLFISSGDVYGTQPPELLKIPENYIGSPDPLDPQSAYGEGKRQAELLCTLYQKKYGSSVTIARCFAFIGPYLNLDIHFAIGNFIRDGILKQPIIVQGDGTPLRSYLFGTDLAVWLWMILLRGKAGCAYNVGSDQAISIVELATLVSQCFSPSPEVQILQKVKRDQPCARYIPDIQLAKKELGLQVYTNLKDSIENTIAWNQ